LTSHIEIDRRDILEVLLATVFFIISYAPSPFGFFIYIAFIPLLLLSKRHSPGRSFLYGYIVGLFVNGVTIYWLLFYSGIGFSLIVMGNSLQLALLSAALSCAFKINESKALLIFPFLWTFLEYIRQFGDLAFTWLNIAHTQTYYLYLIQFAEFTGMSGVVFWICLVNISFFLLLTRYRQKKARIGWILVAFSLFILPLGYGFSKMTERPSAMGISAAYVQPDIIPDTKWEKDFLKQNMKILMTMTDSILVTDPDLVIWPETAIPYQIKNVRADWLTLNRQVRKKHYYLLTGTLDSAGNRRDSLRYNAALLISPYDSVAAVYRKMQMVPVEETFPYKRLLPVQLAAAFSDDLSAGSEAKVFSLRTKLYELSYSDRDWKIVHKDHVYSDVKLSVVICYESIFPNLVQRFVNAGAVLLVIITNDGWFGYTSQPFQHLQAAVFRALEQRLSVIRCANNGFSAFIDPYGRIFLESDLFQAAMAQKVVPLGLGKTFYSEYGDITGIFSGIFVFSFLILTILGKSRRVFRFDS